ncbi:MAG: fasciclin domain-containing protein, partial [Myxococcota bacterium]|nr:fasciclin domain-containing protein [Myxococcota bacterium]
MYDSASNAETFFQGVWIDRARIKVTVLEDGTVHDEGVYMGRSGLPVADLDETSSNGVFYVCHLWPGLHRISYSHPWGTCRVGNKLPVEEDGSYIAYLQEGIINNIGGECDLDPPGNLAQELASHPPLASMHLLMETAGMLEGLSLAELPPEGLLSDQRVTLLAPTDAALSAFLLSNGQLDHEAQERLIKHHMFQGELEADELVTEESHWTMAGTPVRFVQDPDGALRVDGTSATLIEVEHWALDGIIYVIDEVLAVPQDAASSVTSVSTSSSSAEHIGGMQLTHETWQSGFPTLPEFSVYTPPGYYPDAPFGYPVLYVLHDVGGDHHSFFGGPTMGTTPT